MTITEASKTYKIPLALLRWYAMEQAGAERKNKKEIEKGNAINATAFHFTEEDIEKLSLIMTLQDIGFGKKEIETWLRLQQDDRFLCANQNGHRSFLFPHGFHPSQKIGAAGDGVEQRRLDDEGAAGTLHPFVRVHGMAEHGTGFGYRLRYAEHDREFQLSAEGVGVREECVKYGNRIW